MIKIRGVMVLNEKPKIRRIFAYNLGVYLSLRNYSQKNLAKYLGVSGTTVTNWIKGYKMPRMDKIDKICQFLSIDRNQLLSDKITSNSQMEINSLPENSLSLDEKKLVYNYRKLDNTDKAEIRGEIKGLLKSDKYKPEVQDEVI